MSNAAIVLAVAFVIVAALAVVLAAELVASVRRYDDAMRNWADEREAR